MEAGRESVLVWGRESEAQTYGEADGLLDTCLAGRDALALSQALDDLGHSGAAFALIAHSRDGEADECPEEPAASSLEHGDAHDGAHVSDPGLDRPRSSDAR